MPVFIMILVALAALAVLVGVVYVVLGKGGRLARFEADYPPLDLPEDGPVRAPDLNRLVLPLAMWGYHVRAVDELLVRLAATLRAREERIQDLEWRLSRLDPSYVPEGTGPGRSTRLPGDAYAPEAGAAPGPGAVSEPGPRTRPDAASRSDAGSLPDAGSRSDAPARPEDPDRPDPAPEPAAASSDEAEVRPGAASGAEARATARDLREQS
ncbi:hypothetical protein [Nocardiopsis sp. YSL2]|uniref:hypothetical protein n=1 Tax=Nocardiopsis sp. YSL2 TaxID=2939492 RepID=UPI0026F45C8E|nr:hypothetical protein [Nocardiopsis sp. YSL2]